MVVLRSHTTKEWENILTCLFLLILMYLVRKKCIIYSLPINPLTSIPATRASFPIECVCLLHGLQHSDYGVVTFNNVMPPVCSRVGVK
jgi:hypothetical protein